MKTTSLFALFLLFTPFCWSQEFSELTEVAWRVDYIYANGTGDMDGDGDDDLLVSSNEPNLVWYENDLSGNFVSEHILELSGYYLTGINIEDLDGDEDADILALDQLSDALVWFDNDGLGQFTPVQSFAEGLDGLKEPLIADLDGDNDVDIIGYAIYESLIFWIENDGNGQFGAPQDIDADAIWPHFATYGDLDGDNDLDIITSPSETTLYWQENLGDGNFGTKQFISDEVDNVSKLMVVDLNGDLNMDIIANSDYAEELAWYANDGQGVFGPKQLFYSGDIVPDFTIFDFENDGDPDVLFNIALQEVIVRLSNDGSGNFTPAESITHDYYFEPDQFKVMHLNQDGYQDLIVGCEFYQQSILNNAGSALLQPVFVTPQLNGSFSCAHGDLNGDGDVELIFASSSANQILYYDSLGVGAFSNLHIVADSLASPSDVFVEDFDVDGDLDIGYQSLEENSIWWIENDGAGNFSDQHLISTPIEYLDFIKTNDLDGDGDLDILTRRGDVALGWVRNEGNGVFVGASNLSGVSGCKDFAVADLDEDGDKDIVIVQEEIFSVRFNNGNQVFSSGSIYNLPTFGFTGYSIAIGDIDLDSKPDILVSSIDSELRWYKNLGNNQFQTSSAIIDAAAYAGKISFHDLNGDGVEDILSGRTVNGPGYWLRNNGDLTFGYFGFNDGSGIQMKTGDFDNDNDLEVYFAGGNKSGVYYNTFGDGCTDTNACNFDPEANTDDGSCNYDQPGDFNCDGLVGTVDDINLFLASFGCVGSCNPFDLDGDGFVGTNDLMLFFALIGE